MHDVPRIVAIFTASNRQPMLHGILLTLAVVAGCDIPARPDPESFRVGSFPAADDRGSIGNSNTVASTTGPRKNSDPSPVPGRDAAPGGDDGPVPGGEESAGDPSPAAGQDSFPARWQTFELRYRNRHVTGYSHIISEPAEGAGVLVTADSRRLRPIAQGHLVESAHQSMWHNAEGELRRMESRWRSGPLVRRQDVRVTPEGVEFVAPSVSGEVTTRVKTSGPLAGPLFAYQTLLQDPLPPGGRRVSRVVVPGIARVAELEMRCTGPAAVSGLLPTEGPLNEVLVISSIADGTHGTMFHWFDDQGLIHKSNVAGEPTATFRCSAEQYETLGAEVRRARHPLTVWLPGKPLPDGPLKQVGFELQPLRDAAPPASPAPPSQAERSADGQSADAEGTARAEATSQTADGQAAGSDSAADGRDHTASRQPLWPTAGRQYVQKRPDSTADRSTPPAAAESYRVIVCDHDVPTQKLQGRYLHQQTAPTRADVAPTPLVNFRSAEVRRLSEIASVDRDQQTQWEQALELARLVHTLLSPQPLSDGFRPASEIAGSSAGDSTEQALLLMALLRSKDLPCRLTLGLAHDTISAPSDAATEKVAEDEHSQDHAGADHAGTRFVYRAWVQVFVDGNWRPLDPGEGGLTGRARLAVLVDDLSEADPANLWRQYLDRLASHRIGLFAAVAR